MKCPQSLSNYYYPKVGDLVIGKVVGIHMGQSSFSQKASLASFASYEVDIGAYSLAALGDLEFEGATKRNKPKLDNNTLVYCRVKGVDHFSKPTLTCISPVHKKSWETGESYFGQLKGGFLCEISHRLSKYLQAKSCYLLSQLGTLFAFEIVVGFNGKVWVNAKQGKLTTL